MRPQNRTADRQLASVAGRQHGVVRRAALLRAGVSADEIKHRLRVGALIREYPGVYRVGHRAPSMEASYMAAVLACGEGALLSGRAAGHLLGLTKRQPPLPEVTTKTERRVEGIRTRRCRHADACEAMRFRGIPVTTVPRTLVDLARVLAEDDLARACHEAAVLHRCTPAQVEEVLARRPNSPGANVLKAVLRGDVRVTLNILERRFLALLRDAGLALPETNRIAGTRRVDCRWPSLRLTIELDGYRYHGSRHAWEQDRRREREARARGDEFRRYTYGDVIEDPRAMLSELRGLLPRADTA